MSKFLLHSYSSVSTDVLSQENRSCLGSRELNKSNWLLLCNAQSLFYKLDELRALVTTVKPTFVCVTETWFTPAIEDNLIRISNFQLFRTDRQDNVCDTRRGGGTAIYASTKVQPHLIDIPDKYTKPAGVEYSLISFHDPNLSFLLCAYVPPGLNMDIFMAFRYHLTDILDYVLGLSPDAKIFVCGDFNRYDFSFLSNEFSLKNIVQIPTFHEATLDKFFCDQVDIDKFSVQAAPPLGTAVHLHNIIVVSKCEKETTHDVTLHKVFDLRKSNIHTFCKRVSKIDWSPMSNFNSIDECVAYLYEQFYAAMSVIPVSYVRITSATKPWITPVVIHLINKRWQAFKDKNFILYNHYKCKVKSEILKSKVIWSQKMKATSKGIWSIVYDSCGKKELNSVNALISLFSDPMNAVEYVNSLFSSFFHTHGTIFVSAHSNCNDDLICDYSLVCKMLHKLNTNKAMGSDHIPPILLKSCAFEICKPLADIYNKSYNDVSVPAVWKTADVIPLPKTIPVTKTQLRPISLLPILSKVYERIVLKRHYDLLMHCYDDSQFAYRKNSSTTCALLTIQENILRFLDDPEICAVRLLTFDMSHAFDCVPHDILVNHILRECESFGGWLANYLSQRRQRVRLGNTMSSFSDVTSGVPQGSILGPYLFSVFMSSFSAFDLRTKLVKYADDVSIIVPVFKEDIEDLSLVTNEIVNFSSWCSENHMTINASKTQVLTISLGSNLSKISPVPNLNNVKCLKTLGLIFNCHLTWKNHFDYIISKLSRRLYVLRIVKSLLSHDEMVMVFNAAFRSITDYACQVFLNPGKMLDSRLIRLCRRAFKIFHSDKVCNYCDLCNVVERRFLLSMRLFNAIKEDRDHILYALLPPVSERSKRLILPHVNTSRRVDGFIFSCASLYNQSL